ncbi:MAG: hypothetical protein AAGH15_17985, partial [Myxococcota bacterium]
MACSAPAAPDLRTLTPRATLGTLFGAYGIEALSGAEVAARMDRGRGFHLGDPEALRACFADWTVPEHEALAGFVFGGLAPAKDRLRVVVAGDSAHVFVDGPDAHPPAVLRREGDAWRIVLAESVPAAGGGA